MFISNSTIAANQEAPRAIGSLIAWYRGDSAVYDSSNNVSRWTDKSGNGYHLLQSNASLQPKYVSAVSGKNNQPAVSTFGFSGKYMEATSVPMSRARTAIMVLGRLGTANYMSVMTNGGTLHYQLYQPSSATFYNGFSGNFNTASKAPFFEENANHIFTFDLVTSKLYKNNTNYATNVVTGGTTATAGTDTGTLSLFSYTGGSGVSEFDCCEYILFSKALTPSEIAKVVRYLEARYTSNKLDTESVITATAPFADYNMANASVSGGVIDSVTDTIGGRNLTSTGTQRPAYTATDVDFNNNPSAAFDGLDDRLITAIGTLSDWRFLHNGNGSEICIVFRRTDSTFGRPIFRTQNASGADIGTTLINNSGNPGRAAFIVGNGSDFIQTSHTTDHYSTTQTRILNCRYKEASTPKSTIYIAGADTATATAWGSGGTPVATDPAKPLVIGNYYDTFDQGAAVKIARVIIWNRELTSNERFLVMDALARKYYTV